MMAEYKFFPPAGACPKCQGAIYRIKRHFFDRIISLFVRAHRYRCRSNECGWEGLMRAQSLAVRIDYDRHE
jgi:hypothetical protein